MTQDETGAPAAGLYVCVALADFREKIQAIRQIIMVVNRSAYERNMHVFEIVAEPGEDDRTALDFIALAQEAGFVALISGDAVLAATLEADGAVLDDVDDIAGARKILGQERIVGLRCTTDMARADQALANGVDFVSFSSEIDLKNITQWAAQTKKPCLVDGALSCEEAAHFVAAGATFIQAGPYIFNHPKGALQSTVNMLDAIEKASGLSSIALN